MCMRLCMCAFVQLRKRLAIAVTSDSLILARSNCRFMRLFFYGEKNVWSSKKRMRYDAEFKLKAVELAF